MPEFWDFNEDINYTTTFINGNNYKVLNYIDATKAALLLYNIDQFIQYKLLRLSKNMNKYPKGIRNGLSILLDTEYSCQEMQLNTQFEGLNKPKCLHYSPYYPSVGEDKQLRACRRVIFFKLRDFNLSFVKRAIWGSIISADSNAPALSFNTLICTLY